MKVLLVAAGTGFLTEDPERSDLFGRHEAYLAALQRLAPGSEMRMLCLGRGVTPSGWTRRGAFEVAACGLGAAARQLVAPDLFRDWRPDEIGRAHV